MLVIGLCFLFSACSPKIKKPDWKFEKETVQVHIKADHKLNLYNSKAHTLYVCFYQLSELNGFDQLAQDMNGIQKLLECKLFDSSVAAVTSKIIHAGENITLTLDRAERAQYIAVVTGYSGKLSDTRMVRRHKIQVYRKMESFFKYEYRCIPCPLNIELVLGPNQIEYSKAVGNDKKCSDECE